MRYLPLWGVLATSFAIFALISFFEHPTILGHEFKTTGFADEIFGERATSVRSETPGATASHQSEAPAAAVADAFPMPLDTAAQTILFIGDSMLEGLGPRMAAYADQNGHTLYEVMWYSSTSDTWGSSDKLEGYIARLKPTFVLICLGANELFVPDIATRRADKVKAIVEKIGDIPFLWIGPPNWKKDTGINSLIKESVPRGSFFLSAGMNFDRTKDGAHPTRSSAAAWLDSVARWMPDSALHPIRMAYPDKQSGKARRIFIHKPGEK